jgi:hypothetical protein
MTAIATTKTPIIKQVENASVMELQTNTHMKQEIASAMRNQLLALLTSAIAHGSLRQMILLHHATAGTSGQQTLQPLFANALKPRINFPTVQLGATTLTFGSLPLLILLQILLHFDMYEMRSC